MVYQEPDLLMSKGDIKDIKRKSFAKGMATAFGIVGSIVLITYFVSGFGDRYEYQITEPDFDTPVLKEDIYQREGDVDGSETDVKVIEEY